MPQLPQAADNVGVTFVNGVLARGIFNNVVNITLGTLYFTPDDENTSINPDMHVSARLRMDIVCARQIVDTLSSLLSAIDHEPIVAPPAPDGVAAGKPN